MNKQLIMTYFEEFKHWLHEGKILYKDKNSTTWWSDNCWNYSPEYVHAVIINDDYVKFRKALAENKTIQYKSYTTEEWIDFNKGFEPIWEGIKNGDFVGVSIGAMAVVEEVNSNE